MIPALKHVGTSLAGIYYVMWEKSLGIATLNFVSAKN